MPKKNLITQTDLDMVARLNSERFSSDDLLEISDAVHDTPEVHTPEFLIQRITGQEVQADQLMNVKKEVEEQMQNGGTLQPKK